MKKVFRTRKFIEKCIEFGQIEHIVDNMLSDGNWCQKLEGKTLQEIHKMGYECNENWLVEE